MAWTCEYTLASLHQKLGYVPQRAVMFSGTITSNVGYGADHATEAQVKQAVQIAQAADFVDSVGYAGPVAQGAPTSPVGRSSGWPLPGPCAGSRKSTSSTTASPPWTIGPTGPSGRTLKRETAGVTSLIVAQRIGTIRDADLILVLDNGKVVGQGTHRELLESCEVYRQIALSQLSKEELEHA